jgi:ATP-dependent DNA helicase RecQ
MIIDILRGSGNEKIKRLGLDSLSVWGIMADTKAHRIRVILDFLIDDGCLRIEGDEYPVVTLGRGLEEIVREERHLYMKLPSEQKDKPQPALVEENPLQKIPPNAGSLRPVVNEPALESYDKELFERLKELRKILAAQEGVPAYIVFPDASLRDMCRKKPASLAQFSTITGVGAVKLEKYGDAFIRLIRNEG